MKKIFRLKSKLQKPEPYGYPEPIDSPTEPSSSSLRLDPQTPVLCRPVQPQRSPKKTSLHQALSTPNLRSSDRMTLPEYGSWLPTNRAALKPLVCLPAAELAARSTSTYPEDLSPSSPASDNVSLASYSPSPASYTANKVLAWRADIVRRGNDHEKPIHTEENQARTESRREGGTDHRPQIIGGNCKDITQEIGWLTERGSDDWGRILVLCEKVKGSDTSSKEAAHALLKDIKCGEISVQLRAARLWGILLRNSEEFRFHSSSTKFLESLETVLMMGGTSSVVKGRLLLVLSAAAYTWPEGGFWTLWRKVRPPDSKQAGTPFNDADPIFNPPASAALSSMAVSQLNSETSEAGSLQNGAEKSTVRLETNKLAPQALPMAHEEQSQCHSPVSPPPPPPSGPRERSRSSSPDGQFRHSLRTAKSWTFTPTSSWFHPGRLYNRLKREEARLLPWPSESDESSPEPTTPADATAKALGKRPTRPPLDETDDDLSVDREERPEVHLLVPRVLTARELAFNLIRDDRDNSPHNDDDPSFRINSFVQHPKTAMKNLKRLEIPYKSSHGSPSLNPTKYSSIIDSAIHSTGIVVVPTSPELSPNLAMMDLTAFIEKHGEYANTGGGFADVWRASYRVPRATSELHEEVALKVIRPYRISNSKLRARLAREMNIWASLQHCNVLPFIGFTRYQVDIIGLVSPWINHGNVMDYLKLYPYADRTNIIRGIASGVEYLHTRVPEVIHGDLKGANVLVDDHGAPLLCDFGLSTFTGSVEMTSSSIQHGSLRWMAPERISPNSFGIRDSQSRTKASDVFSFAMTAFEILSGTVPFENETIYGAQTAIVSGRRPILHTVWPNFTISAVVGQTISACWNAQASERPSAGTVVDTLS